MGSFTPGELATAVLGIASAFVLLSNAFEKLGNAWRAIKAPNTKQDERLSTLEEWKKGVDQKLANDKKHLDTIDEGNRASQRALLALTNEPENPAVSEGAVTWSALAAAITEGVNEV